LIKRYGWILLILLFAGAFKVLDLERREVSVKHGIQSKHKVGVTQIEFSLNLWSGGFSLEGKKNSGLGVVASVGPYSLVKKVNGLPKLAIIIDDFGYSDSIATRFAYLPYKLTFSVLPNLRFSSFSAEIAHRNGKQVLLHLPMQAYKHVLDSNVVSIGMGIDDIRRIVDRALVSVPYAVGVNNHMGSLATADPVLMRKVIRVLMERGLFFIDSYTTPDTVAYHIAMGMGLPSYYNSLFIDRYSGENKVEEYILRLLSIAKRRSTTIGIGHAKQETFNALTKLLPVISKQVEVVFASDIVYRNGVVMR